MTNLKALAGFLALAILCPFAVGTSIAADSVSASTAQLFDDPVLARGKGLQIKRSELEDAFTAYAANLAARGESLQADERTIREAQLLDRLITTRLLVNRAVDKDRGRAKELSLKFIHEAQRSTSSEEMFRRQLKAAGMTLEGFTNRVMEQALAEAVIERELRPTVSVTDAQVDEFYKTGVDFMVKDMENGIERLGRNPNTTIGELADARKRVEEVKRLNLAKLEQPEKAHVSHILISTREPDSERELPPEKKKEKLALARKILSQAKGGEDFGKLMKQYSDDKSSGKGEYTFSREDPFVPEFKSAAFTLEPNHISDIVTTTFGYHIIKLHDRTAAKKMEFAKAGPEIKEALLQQAVQRKMPEYFVSLKKDAAIEILDSKYKIEAPKLTADAARPRS